MKTVNQYSKHRYPHNPGIHSHKKVSNIRKNDKEFFMKKNYSCHSDTWSFPNVTQENSIYPNITKKVCCTQQTPKTKRSNQLLRSTIEIQGYPTITNTACALVFEYIYGLSIAANIHPIETTSRKFIVMPNKNVTHPPLVPWGSPLWPTNGAQQHSYPLMTVAKNN